MIKVNHAYGIGPVSVLVIEQVGDVWIISIQKRVGKAICQFPFVPVHVDVLSAFVAFATDIGEFIPNSVEQSMDIWESMGKSFFTIPISEIWETGILALNNSKRDPSEFKCEHGFLFPPVMPAKMSQVNDKHEYIQLDHSIGLIPVDVTLN